MDELKQKYNKLLERQDKAEEYLNHPDRTQEEIRIHMPRYKVIIKQLNQLIIISREYGHEMTHEEIIHGFKQEEGRPWQEK